MKVLSEKLRKKNFNKNLYKAGVTVFLLSSYPDRNNLKEKGLLPIILITTAITRNVQEFIVSLSIGHVQ